MNNQSEDNSQTVQHKSGSMFSLYHNQAHPDAIDNDIRSDAQVSGTNLWVLMFAILIACIGLNMNSTAVVIGAMLISPLMGPIVGIGYGVAVSDIGLIRLSIRNIFIFIVIALVTATLYFLISPLQQAQSELLARTQPNLWDVLIAFFGGSAGIIALTRKEMSNVIPGVAIATALMPPLCTAGYGLATSNWDYFFGAFYLFTINCVFIAFSTLLFCKLLRLPRRGLLTESTRRFYNIVIFLVVSGIMIPSIYLAMNLIKKEVFNTKAMNSIQAVQRDEKFFILNSDIDEKKQSVRLIINGSGNTEKISEKLTQQLQQIGLDQAHVQVLYAGGSLENLNDFKNELLNNQENSTQLKAQLAEQQQHIQALMSQKNEQDISDKRLLQELQAQYPDVQQMTIGQGTHWQGTPSAKNNESTYIVILQTSKAISDDEQQRLKAWLKARLQQESIQLVIQPAIKPNTNPKTPDETN
ncbi:MULTISPECIES: TIGR00341 family protein [unclassified Moraxella]|uniref:TIGR00341 family protein n=1 Tax=unclassified Moraxella TaxID=2685852 RepID=UPI003AF53ED8